MFSLPEEIVGKYPPEEVVSWAEAQLKTMRQVAMSKEVDKAFLLGQVASGLRDVASVLEALRKKMKPQTKNEPPVVAG